MRWTALVMLLSSGCFADPVDVDSGEGAGTSDGTASTSPADDDDDDVPETSGDDDDDDVPGTSDDDDDDDDAVDSGEASDSDDTTDGPMGDVVFDYFVHACDEMTERFGYNASTADFGLFECGAAGPLGGVQTLADTPLASGGEGQDVVVLSLPPFTDSQVSLDSTGPVLLAGTDNPTFIGTIDCPVGAAGSVVWQINYTGEEDGNLPPVTSGAHSCGSAAVELTVPLSASVDRKVGFVLINDGANPAAIALVAPRIVTAP